MENKRYYIYKITLLKGSLAGKYYFGKRKLQKGINNPMCDGYFGSGIIVKQYYKKYPFEQGVTANKEILEMNYSEEENCEREKYYIGDKYETDPNCLNLKAGGIGGLLSEEAKKKLSNNKLLYYKTEDGKKQKELLRNQMLGKPKTKEAVKKQSASMKGKSHPQTDETRHKISEALKGKPSKLKGTTFTEDRKKKIAEASKGNKSRSGMPHSEETRAKMKEAAKRVWAERKALKKAG